MMMVTDYELAIQIAAVRTRYNADTTLKLFVNNYTPIPDSGIGNFTEATFGGYTDFDLTGDWGAPVENADGDWYIEATASTFVPDGGGPFETVYGAYIVDGTNVVLAERFSTPLVIDATALPFRVTPRYTHAAQAVVCP